METYLSDLMYGVNEHDFTPRIIFSLIVGTIAFFIVRRGWEWYVEDLYDDTIRPKWSSPTANIVLWIVWYATLGFVWGYHIRNHPRRHIVDAFYVVILFIAISFQVAFFDRQSFSTSKWLASILFIVTMYLMYDSFISGNWLTTVCLVYQFGIVLYAAIQLWFMSYRVAVTENMNGCRRCISSSSRSSSSSGHSHPWSGSSSGWS